MEIIKNDFKQHFFYYLCGSGVLAARHLLKKVTVQYYIYYIMLYKTVLYSNPEPNS